MLILGSSVPVGETPPSLASHFNPTADEVIGVVKYIQKCILGHPNFFHILLFTNMFW